MAEDVAARVQAEVKDASTVLFILDSDHSRDQVFGELKVYGPMEIGRASCRERV